MSSLFPNGEYRSLPIVWLTRAFLFQVAVLFVSFFVLYGFEPVYTIIFAACFTAYVGISAWRRGIGSSSLIWKITTASALLFNLILVSIAAQDRIPFAG